jgi:cytoskeletal protein RodZ
MKQQDNNPLDELFASLAEPKAEAPSAAFLQDVEARLDALAQKRRKPLAFWWIWSAFGAVLTFGSILFWQGDQVESVPTSAKQVARKTQRVSGTNNTKVATFNLNISKPNSSIPLNTSNPTSTYSQPFISSIKNPPVFSLSPSVGASIPGTYLISASDFQDKIETNTSIIDTNGRAKDNQQPVIASISTHPKESAKPTKKSQSLGLQFGVSGIFSSFEVPSGSSGFVQPFTPKELREWRELGERHTSSWDFSLRYQLFFGQWGLQTGLSYLEWGEQYTYKVISVEGTNRYQYVQIPLGLSYQIPLRKVLLQPAIGIGLGYGVRRDGAYILPNNNGVAVVESKKWATNAYAQFELIYQVNAQLQFSLAPMFRYSLGRIVSDELIKNQYQSLGLLTGFSFAF